MPWNVILSAGIQLELADLDDSSKLWISLRHNVPLSECGFSKIIVLNQQGCSVSLVFSHVSHRLCRTHISVYNVTTPTTDNPNRNNTGPPPRHSDKARHTRRDGSRAFFGQPRDRQQRIPKVVEEPLDSPVPPGWSKAYTKSKRPPYRNDHDQTTTWDKPTDPASGDQATRSSRSSSNMEPTVGDGAIRGIRDKTSGRPGKASPAADADANGNGTPAPGSGSGSPLPADELGGRAAAACRLLIGFFSSLFGDSSSSQRKKPKKKKDEEGPESIGDKAGNFLANTLNKGINSGLGIIGANEYVEADLKNNKKKSGIKFGAKIKSDGSGSDPDSEEDGGEQPVEAPEEEGQEGEVDEADAPEGEKEGEVDEADANEVGGEDEKEDDGK